MKIPFCGGFRSYNERTARRRTPKDFFDERARPHAAVHELRSPPVRADSARVPLRRKQIFRLPPPAPTTIYVRPGYNRVLAEQFEALKAKRVELVKGKVEAHSQGDLRENFGFKAAKDAIRAVDRKMTALDRFVARNTFIEVDPATWLTKPTDTLQLGHVVTLEKQDVRTKRIHRFTFLVTTHGETAIDPESGIECLPHNSPLAAAALGLAAGEEAHVNLPAGEARLTVVALRNPTRAELDRLLTAIKPPEIDEE
jgi:transcription elongation factor GreA